jgi:SAM-dependent methyltransferase
MAGKPKERKNSERLSMTSHREITNISAPVAVSMADQWFAIATLDHFWIQRRFEVLRILADDLVAHAKEMAEIGCGNGLLQRQIEEAYGREIAGYDLNEFALKRNISRSSPIFCYDIYERKEDLRERYDLIFLFDVLEHIKEEGHFVEAIKFHLAPRGRIIVNVPAGQWAYSGYDRAAGHVRRYSIGSLRDAVHPYNLRVTAWSYWGLPLVPALFLRKLWLSGGRGEENMISTGFNSRNKFVDRCLRLISKCEPIPQKLMGTSLLAILQASGK